METLITNPQCYEDYNVLRGQKIPEEYKKLSPDKIDQRITSAIKNLGKKVVILGHHYQREDIIKYADYKGDSLKLSQLAAQHKDAKFILFCGVHFMAESADILSGDEQIVILPNMEAGCSMADMANIGQVENCWKELEEAGVSDVIPITYINSAANLKAFVGKNGGAVCTSSNAPSVMKWAFQQGNKVLFFPDQHLGRITALTYGTPLAEMVLWDPFEYRGGYGPFDLQKARVILWKGHCSVHARFKLDQIEKARKEYPGIKVIVHPECTLDVVHAADEYGSTEYITRRITESPSGSTWAVGTEINLVSRLANEMPDKTIFCLDPIICPCATMYRIHPAYLCWVLENLVQGRIINQVKVPAEITHWSKIALDRMLQNI